LTPARQRRHLSYGGSAELKTFTKTFIGLTYSTEGTLFDESAVFKDVSLHDELSRKSTTAGVQVRHQATPLTAFTVNVSRTNETFDYDSLRDSTSTQISAGVVFDPFALVKGGATIGYRSFKPSADLPSYQGLTMAVNLSYAAFGTTRFAAGATRDIQYSYEETQPYYLQTSFQGSIAQQIFRTVRRGGPRRGRRARLSQSRGRREGGDGPRRSHAKLRGGNRLPHGQGPAARVQPRSHQRFRRSRHASTPTCCSAVRSRAAGPCPCGSRFPPRSFACDRTRSVTTFTAPSRLR